MTYRGNRKGRWILTLLPWAQEQFFLNTPKNIALPIGLVEFHASFVRTEETFYVCIFFFISIRCNHFRKHFLHWVNLSLNKLIFHGVGRGGEVCTQAST